MPFLYYIWQRYAKKEKAEKGSGFARKNATFSSHKKMAPINRRSFFHIGLFRVSGFFDAITNFVTDEADDFDIVLLADLGNGESTIGIEGIDIVV